MSATRFIIKLRKVVALCCLPVCLLVYSFICSPVGRGQDPAPKKSGGQDQPDVLRVYTELIQTDVMVFDQQGRFVNGLKSSDFELRIDGKPRQIEFFEKITAGSVNEESQLAAARGATAGNEGHPLSGAAPLDRGRPIFFYVDDMHLDLPSLNAARKLITHFIDREMGQNDEAAITSANGQIGFLQQLTDNKTVLQAAVARLKLRPHAVRDFERPAMSEYQALRITQGDVDISGYFIDATLRENPGMTADTAAAIVASRARALVQQGAYITTTTLAGLEGLVRSANRLPGRKLVFFISGGFLIDDLNSDTRSRLQRITSAAARSGVVIYSIDARGLIASLTDASDPGQPDLSGRLQRGGMSEISTTQDGMNALASDTGGRATFNTNALEPGLTRALRETSNYYLLAWKPETQNAQSSKFRRIEVKVVGKPNLVVQVRRGFFDREPESATKSAKAPKNSQDKKAEANVPKVPEVELRKVMTAAYPNRDIPVSLSLSYMHTPGKGPLLSTVLQVANEFLLFEPVNGKETAVVTVAGTVFDDKGNSGARFSNRITIDAASKEVAKEGHDLTYSYPVYIGPGLYQVRVGVRDDKTGRTGTAHGWIEIPNLSSGQLTLSSLLIGVRTPAEISNASATEGLPDSVDLSVAHHFAPNGYMRFLVIAYNAVLSPADSKPDLAIQVQVVRDNQPVVTTALKKISVEGLEDLTRIPYAAEVSLGGLSAGHYILQVTAVDRLGKKSASQQTRFEIE